MALLEIAGLGKTFGGLKAVSDVSFGVNAGEIVGLIGPNGAGKSTLVNLVSGAIDVTAGTIRFADEDVTRLPAYQRARRGLVRTFQSTAIYGSQSIRENVLRGAYLTAYPGFVPAFLETRDARRRREAAEALVDDVLSWLDLDGSADRVAGSVPYGHQKTIGIAIALAARPKLILLDEPVAGVSAQEANRIRDAIETVRQSGVTVVVVDHNMRFISGLCDRIVVLHHGQELAHGAPKTVLADPKVIEAYLGTFHADAVDQ
jgi:branched-chain amino acid transport system ATP-binding protein